MKARDSDVSDEIVKEEPASPATTSRSRSLRWAGGLSLLAVVAVVGTLAHHVSVSAGDDSRTIGYLPFAELKVGESVLVHAKRGECGEAPPEWREFEHEIPVLETGRLIDDGLGTSRSSTCGGVTPGRLVRFIAQKPGEEIFDLFQRQIKVVVHE